MELIVNGRARRIPGAVSIQDVLASLGHGEGARGLAVALNGEVVRRAEWASTRLAERDRVEVLGAAQGG